MDSISLPLFLPLVSGTIAMQQSCGEQYNWNIAQLPDRL